MTIVQIEQSLGAIAQGCGWAKQDTGTIEISIGSNKQGKAQIV